MKAFKALMIAVLVVIGASGLLIALPLIGLVFSILVPVAIVYFIVRVCQEPDPPVPRDDEAKDD